MGASRRALSQALAAIVGVDGLLTDPASLAASAVDGVVPAWVARPARVEDVSRLLGLASDEGLAVVPRGSGLRMGLGNPPRGVDMVLDVSGLDALLAYEPDDLTVSVECGMTLGALASRLAARRQFLPLDPLEGGPALTVGGVVATNGSGPLRSRYGTPRDLLLGVRFVQADGTVTWGGARVVKSVTGYDTPKLMAGSLGTLGILVEATLRLHPIPEAEATWLVTFPSFEHAAGLVAAVLDSALQPHRLELVGSDGGAAAAAVAVSFGSVPDAVSAQGESLLALARRHGGAAETAEEDFWMRVPGLLADASVGLRVAVLPSQGAAIAAEIQRLAAALGLAFAVVGEAGHGVLHIALGGALPARAWQGRVLGPLRERVAPAGGSVVVERAPREVKEGLDVWGPVEPAALALMKRVKAEFDPLGRLNPGRYVDGI